MNRQEATEILSLYRPGTADELDPAFAEALLLCEHDPESKLWFQSHCESYHALRALFKKIPVPEGFKEQIVAERQVHAATSRPRWTLALAVVTALTVVALIIGLRWSSSNRAGSLPGFRNWTVSTSLRLYKMDLESHDLDQIRGFLARNKSASDYVLPERLQRSAKATGCASLEWHGQRVSMICFHSGKPLYPGDTSDLFLFVAESSAVRGTPNEPTPSLAKVSRTTTACWQKNGKIYFLVAAGDEKFIRQYL